LSLITTSFWLFWLPNAGWWPYWYHPQSPYRWHALPGNIGVDGSVDPGVLFRTFYEPGLCLFYDTQLRTYTYVKDGAYAYWNYSRHQFKTVQDLAGYRSLCRTGVQ